MLVYLVCRERNIQPYREGHGLFGKLSRQLAQLLRHGLARGLQRRGEQPHLGGQLVQLGQLSRQHHGSVQPLGRQPLAVVRREPPCHRQPVACAPLGALPAQAPADQALHTCYANGTGCYATAGCACKGQDREASKALDL